MKRYLVIFSFMFCLHPLPMEGKGVSFTFDQSYDGFHETLSNQWIHKKNAPSVLKELESEKQGTIPQGKRQETMLQNNQPIATSIPKLQPKMPEPRLRTLSSISTGGDLIPQKRISQVAVTQKKSALFKNKNSMIRSIQDVQTNIVTQASNHGLGYQVIGSEGIQKGSAPLSQISKEAINVVNSGTYAYNTLALSLPTGIGTEAMTLIDQGNRLLTLGNIQEAENNYKKAIENSPNSHLPYIAMANYYESRADFEKAAAIYLKALDILPNNPNLNYNTGLNYFKNNDYDRAITYLFNTIRCEPGYTLAYYHLGMIYYNKEDYTNAAQNFEQTVKLNPFLEEAFIYLSHAYNKMGNTKLARVYKDKYTALNPGSGQILQLVSK